MLPRKDMFWVSFPYLTLIGTAYLAASQVLLKNVKVPTGCGHKKPTAVPVTQLAFNAHIGDLRPVLPYFSLITYL